MSLCICDVIATKNCQLGTLFSSNHSRSKLVALHCMIASNLRAKEYEWQRTNGWTGSGHYLGAGGVHAEVVEAADDALLDVEP